MSTSSAPRRGAPGQEPAPHARGGTSCSDPYNPHRWVHEATAEFLTYLAIVRHARRRLALAETALDLALRDAEAARAFARDATRAAEDSAVRLAREKAALEEALNGRDLSGQVPYVS